VCILVVAFNTPLDRVSIFLFGLFVCDFFLSQLSVAGTLNIYVMLCTQPRIIDRGSIYSRITDHEQSLNFKLSLLFYVLFFRCSGYNVCYWAPDPIDLVLLPIVFICDVLISVVGRVRCNCAGFLFIID